jgi:stage II sporulation protein M
VDVNYVPFEVIAVQALKRLLKESRSYIFAALIIFVVGGVIGYVLYEQVHVIIASMLADLEDIAEALAEQDSPLYASFVIFVNNLIAALVMLLVGAVLFFIPIFSLFMNGLLVGYVLKLMAVEAGTAPLSMLVFGIMPHGILELPAIFLAGGVGMFFGFRFLHWLFGRDQFFSYLFRDDRDGGFRTFWQEKSKPALQQRLKQAGALIAFLTVVLFVAAFVEGFITPILIYGFM